MGISIYIFFKLQPYITDSHAAYSIILYNHNLQFPVFITGFRMISGLIVGCSLHTIDYTETLAMFKEHFDYYSPIVMQARVIVMLSCSTPSKFVQNGRC